MIKRYIKIKNNKFLFFVSIISIKFSILHIISMKFEFFCLFKLSIKLIIMYGLCNQILKVFSTSYKLSSLFNY